jgi:hypothetical protein
MRRWLLLLVFLLLPVTARADFLWDLRVGAKAAVTGNLWAAPDGAPRISGADAGWQNALFFVGGGGGLMVELHALKFLALEVDVLYEQNGFKESINGGVVTIYTRYTQVRLPILAKAVLPLGLVELSLGVGPEFTFGRSAWLDTSGLLASSGLGAATANDTFVDIDLGVCLNVWKLAIPISLRTAINVTQPKDWQERFDSFDAARGTFVVKASESFQFALLAGVAYVF